jgi:hypothetical protein
MSAWSSADSAGASIWKGELSEGTSKANMIEALGCDPSPPFLGRAPPEGGSSPLVAPPQGPWVKGARTGGSRAPSEGLEIVGGARMGEGGSSPPAVGGG